jgi:tRNA pseudouridine32 synthase/23S rRNA pseudouridine746 synthase
VGDDLYGSKANRLHLHAESLTFEHPELNKVIRISNKPEF